MFSYYRILQKKLLELYQETNGNYGNFGTFLIWSTEQMVEENLFFGDYSTSSVSTTSKDTFLLKGQFS